MFGPNNRPRARNHRPQSAAPGHRPDKPEWFQTTRRAAIRFESRPGEIRDGSQAVITFVLGRMGV